MKNTPFQNSYIRSWQFSSDDFSPVLERLLAGDILDQPVIYKTHHKDCRLIDQAYSKLPYSVVMKRYYEDRFFRYLFRPSQAYREYCGFFRVQELGIPVARVVALGEIRRGVRLKEAFFVTEFLENYRDGNEFTADGCDKAMRDEFIRQNLCYLAKLHAAGLVHGGFHPRNELYRIDGKGVMSVAWIDLATVMPAKKSRRFSAEKDLERFLREFRLSDAEYSDFLSIYRRGIGIC